MIVVGVGVIVEAEITWPDSSAKKLFDLVVNDPQSEELIGGFIVPSLDVLYMLKMSHRYLRNSPHFLKTMRDIQLMRKHGAKISTRYKEFYKERMAETYWYKHPKLNVDKKGFFNEKENYNIFVHDDIHRAVRHLSKPAYEFYQVDDEEVLCSKDKFYSVTEEIRMYGALEEAYVLALERHQIPNSFKPKPEQSFDIAMMKVCTSITSGWFREYCWENYNRVVDLYQYDKPNYVERFKTALAHGEVRPFKED